MAYALVGTIGAQTQGASGGSVSPTFGTGESRTAGNLLILFVGVTGSAATAPTPSGWNSGVVVSGTSCYAGIYWKIATGGDTAPTYGGVSGALIAAQLAEFSGNATSSPVDKTGGGSGIGSPVTAILSAADTATGELLIIASADFRSAARTSSDTLTSNNATITQAGSNNALSSANHYSFGYSLATTANASPTTAIQTLSNTQSITGLIVVGATFLLAPSGPAIPDLFQQPLSPPHAKILWR